MTNNGSYTYDNAEKLWTVGLENSYFFNKISFFQTYLSQRLWYSDMKVDSQAISSYGGASLSYSLSMNNTFFFNHSKTFQGTCYLSYKSPRYDGGVRYLHAFDSGAGLAYTLMDGKLRLAVDAYNVLSNQRKMILENPDYKLFTQQLDTPLYCTFSVTYSFGAEIEDKSERASAQELRSRM